MQLIFCKMSILKHIFVNFKYAVQALQNLKDTEDLQQKFSLPSITNSNHLVSSLFDQPGVYFSIRHVVGI